MSWRCINVLILNDFFVHYCCRSRVERGLKSTEHAEDRYIDRRSRVERGLKFTCEFLITD